MMLSTLNETEVREFGRWMLYHPNFQGGSFASAAQACTRFIYDKFTTPEGSPAFALVRIFRTVTYDALTPHLRNMVDDGGRYLILMGSTGFYETWCDPAQSQQRRIQPIDNRLSPMFQGVFADLGFSIEAMGSTTIPRGTPADLEMTRIFYVHEASQSRFITDQEGFVQVYGIRSVVALGTRFLSGDAYTVIGFTLMPLTEDNAFAFAMLSVYLSTLLARFDEPRLLW